MLNEKIINIIHICMFYIKLRYVYIILYFKKFNCFTNISI